MNAPQDKTHSKTSHNDARNDKPPFASLLCGKYRASWIASCFKLQQYHHIWSVEEMIQMADDYLPKAAKRGPCNKESLDHA